ncbi:LlaJI family restriction endonuclease [Fictibacillus aquaticus]|nr:LlaJI family restriction endonuclease [Fictibacillus aquaticus]
MKLMNNCHFFIEYEWRSINGTQIPSVFYERGFCEKSNSGSVKFKVVGILEHDGEFFIIFPKGMYIPSHDKEKVLTTQLLLKTLNKYSSTNILGAEELTWMGSANSSKLFQTANWIIEDFKQNGLIHTNKRKEQQNGNGRIEWSKSIKQKSPIIINKKFYYLDVITSKNDIVSDQELTIMHSIVLTMVKDSYGWLFDFDYQHDFPNNNYSLKYMLYILNKSLRNTNIDRETRLFKHLITFLNRKVNANLMNVFVTAHFANIWEAACADFIGNMRSLHSLVPNPYWIFEDNKQLTAQIPDILFSKGDSIFIFDAKYYRIKEGIDKLPGWGEIVKQLFYGLSLSKQEIKIYNTFLFPSSYTSGIKYLGFASVKNKESEFGLVLAFGLDVSIVLKYYNSKNKIIRNQVVENLFSEIIKIEFGNLYNIT